MKSGFHLHLPCIGAVFKRFFSGESLSALLGYIHFRDMSMLTGRRQQLTLKSEICSYCTPFTHYGIGKVKLSLRPVF